VIAKGRTVRSDAGNDGNGRKQLAATDEAFCYLTGVQGDFDGAAEKASVTRSNGYWYLNAESACLKNKGLNGWGPKCKKWKAVKAGARCYHYDHT